MTQTKQHSKRRTSRTRRTPPSTPHEFAKIAALKYVTDSDSGIHRRRHGKGFQYLSKSGRVVKDKATLKRIRALVLPPAWKDVWICANPNGHLQAVGVDARGRKQYRYHAKWREIRDEAKFSRLAQFAKALPRIRRRVRTDLKSPGLPREKVLATLVRLLERTLIRVGNEEYARENSSYGLTTFQDRHARVHGEKIEFRFHGKGGIFHEVEVHDRKLARLLKRIQDLPGQELFQYEGEDGKPRSVSSTDLNDYLREISGEEFTAKDFRTWAGTLLAARALQSRHCKTPAERKRAVVDVVRLVASHLRNTVAVCRKCYIHPSVLEHYLSGELRIGDSESRSTADRLQRQLLRWMKEAPAKSTAS